MIEPGRHIYWGRSFLDNPGLCGTGTFLWVGVPVAGALTSRKPVGPIELAGEG
jgi:hypothetical protein